MKLRFILPVCAGFLAVGLSMAAFLQGKLGSNSTSDVSRSLLPQDTSHKGESPSDQPSSQAVAHTTNGDIPAGFDSTLEAALAQTDPTRRAEALQQWADTIGTGGMETMLTKLDKIEKTHVRSEVREALLSSWAERDLAGMVDWFGKRQADDELHQQARDALVWNFGERDPVAMVAWMEQSLSASVRNELYGPFFRQWAGNDPTGAANKLRQLSDASPANTPQWNDMIGQVVAVWAGTDLKGALAWIQSLPEGVTKSQALMEISYRWTAVSPQAAAACAAQQNDPALLKLVAGEWAEKDPQSVAAWAARLPAGDERNAATVNATIVWAQKDPAAAAVYAASLPDKEIQSLAMVTVISAWSTKAPTQAATWVQQLPESPIRAQAMEQLMSAWAGNDPTASSQWLNTLPPSPSRDSAVAAYDNAVGIYSSAAAATSPSTAFQSAGTISNETLRNRSLQEIATLWLTQDPAAAEQKIVQSSLPAHIKSQLLKNISQ